MADDKAQPISELGGDSSGFAAFDVTLGHFVGGVHRGDGAKKAAGESRQAKAARDAGRKVEVRPV